jgi:hypothetical protein
VGSGRDESTRGGGVVETGRYRTELVEKSLEAEAAALTFRRPRDTQPRHISQIGKDHSSALARAWRFWLWRVGRKQQTVEREGGRRLRPGGAERRDHQRVVGRSGSQVGHLALSVRFFGLGQGSASQANDRTVGPPEFYDLVHRRAGFSSFF